MDALYHKDEIVYEVHVAKLWADAGHIRFMEMNDDDTIKDGNAPWDAKV